MNYSAGELGVEIDFGPHEPGWILQCNHGRMS